MDVYEAIEKRYSVRSYEDRPIEADKLDRVLNAGRLAPSGRNRQEWKFVVVSDPDLRKGLAEAADQPFIAEAPTVVAVVATENEHVMHCDVPASPVDCAIAIDHMTLAAVAEGLGTCWIGPFEQGPCRKLLGVPASAKIIELMPIGYPASTAPAKSRKPLAEVVRTDRFE